MSAKMKRKNEGFCFIEQSPRIHFFVEIIPSRIEGAKAIIGLSKTLVAVTFFQRALGIQLEYQSICRGIISGNENNK